MYILPVFYECSELWVIGQQAPCAHLQIFQASKTEPTTKMDISLVYTGLAVYDRAFYQKVQTSGKITIRKYCEQNLKMLVFRFNNFICFFPFVLNVMPYKCFKELVILKALFLLFLEEFHLREERVVPAGYFIEPFIIFEFFCYTKSIFH